MIVIVSGLPRSGTSLVMQMLAAGGVAPFTDGRRVADESNPRGYFEHDRVRGLARDSSWVSEADGSALKVVAPLLPFLPAGPAYRVILVERSMDEVLASQAAMLERSGAPAGRPEAIRPVFERHLAAAIDWAGTRADALLRLEHRAVVHQPADAAQRIADLVGRNLDVEAMAAVVDPGLHRQRSADA